MPIPSSISFVKEDYAKHLLKALKSSNQINEQNGSRKVIHACCEDSEKAVSLTNNRLTSVYMGSLYPGSRFYGSQKCGPGNYEVHVDILHTDMENSTLYGYLKIKGLTNEFPELTTFFHAEIVGPKYSFCTRKWHADQQNDLLHWKKFTSFKPYIDIFSKETFKYNINESDDYIYMRWKEDFLVPNHHVNAINGASYAGFYYICYQRSTDSIKGFYFYRHHKDWFQELNLTHVPERNFGNFEFR